MSIFLAVAACAAIVWVIPSLLFLTFCAIRGIRRHRKPQPHTCPTCRKFPAAAHEECPNCRADKYLSELAMVVECDEFLGDPIHYRRQA